MAAGVRIPVGSPIFRHTAASHLLAIHSPGEVSSELGNSEAVLKRDYKELVYEEEARAFFGIRPKARHLAKVQPAGQGTTPSPAPDDEQIP